MKRKTGAIAGLWIGILLAAGCITGCGSKEAGGDGKETEAVQREEKENCDLAAVQWKAAEKMQDSQETWTLMEYRENFGGKASSREMIKGGNTGILDGTDYYILEQYLKWGQTGEGTQEYYLNQVDLLTLESERRELTLEEGSGVQEELSEQVASLAADLEENWAEIIGIDVNQGKVCLLVLQLNRDKSGPAHCYVVRMDEQQKVESMVDLLPEMERAGMYRDGIVPSGILCDREGRYYVGTGEYGIFDSSGEFLKMAEAPGEAGKSVFCTGRLPDGRPVFESAGTGGQSLFFCLEGLEEKILYQGESQYARNRYLNDKGEIFYAGQGGLVRWDCTSGSCERLYRDSSLNPMECQAIAETSEDTVVMVFYDNSENFMLKLQRDGEVEEKELTVYSLGGALGEQADEYSRKHPGIKIKLVNVKGKDDDKATALNRLMARITAGEKPDLFWVQSEELAVLQDKGLLADLHDLLPEELLDQIFPGVLESGIIGDGLYGIAKEAYIDTMLVSDQIWPGETWSYRDVMALAEGEEGNGRFDVVFAGETAEDMLYHMILRDITAGNSSLVDWEKKECYFESEEFIRVLEFCRKYGWNPESGVQISGDDIFKGMQEGKILAKGMQGDLKVFSSNMAALGEGFRCVGFPTEGSYGGYVSCYEHIAVNAAGGNQKEAADFIQYLFSESVQRRMGIRTVRRDILTENVVDGTKGASGINTYEYPVFKGTDGSIIPLEGKPDGSSFLPEYLAVIEKAKPMSSWIDTLGMLVMEEAAPYFQGDKTAEEAAEIVQSRVWLYLNE